MIEGEQEASQAKDTDLLHCIVNGSERTKFEQFKADSDYLREPLRTELANELDHFTKIRHYILKTLDSYGQVDLMVKVSEFES